MTNTQKMEDLTDHELAVTMRELVKGLNTCAEHAVKRELVVAYNIKPANPPQGLPTRLTVSVMSEVS